ncbi:MAG TPA: hypothetical protein VMV86_02110 [Methanosarcinales archaeon]|nr:hypothetical protein [Methanosarcinales archaeon]
MELSWKWALICYISVIVIAVISWNNQTVLVMSWVILSLAAIVITLFGG